NTLNSRLFLYAYETASRRHVFIEEFDVGWKEGERHRITVSWGAFLTLRLDGRKWFSQAWRGLGGPWGDQPVNRDAPYLLVGTQEGWTHTQSDFFVHTVSFDPNPPPGIVQLLQEHSGGPAALPRATVAIPRLAQPPRLDGVVEDQEWAGAAKVTGLVNIQTMLAMGDLTCFLVGYDEQRLYLGIVAFGREAQSADAACHTRDGKVYLDDAVEIFLQPDAKGPHYQFIGNSFAAIYDGFDGNNGWNGNWNYRTSRREDRWMGEAAIAWTELGRRGPPQPGETWGINFCRELPMMSEIASWALMHRGYIQPDRFGRASFVAAGPFARLDGVEGAARGELSVSLNAICPRPYAGPPIEAELVVADESAILIRKKVALPPDQTAKVSLGERVMPGEYVLTYQVGAAGANLLAGTYAFSTSPPFQVAVKRYPTLGYVEAALDTRGMSALPTGAKARAAILDAQANALNSAESAQPGAENTFNLRLATERVAVGPFRVRGELLDGAGRVLHSATLEQEKRPAPWWLNSKAGVTRTVLPPWTPMKVTRPLAVSCWGRDVSYREAVLPTSIVSNGKDLLAAPMRFVARVAGKTVELQQGKADVKASAEDAVDLATAAEAGGLRVNTTAHFEYDGLIRVEAVLSGASVDSLALEIPLKAEHSIL
ncbi:MAG: hypothetical protein FJ279_33455, partial [Planctomycetes bacterium]|nr:hypothetical protein [Planctomycetota bacterium]